MRNYIEPILDFIDRNSEEDKLGSCKGEWGEVIFFKKDRLRQISLINEVHSNCIRFFEESEGRTIIVNGGEYKEESFEEYRADLSEIVEVVNKLNDNDLRVNSPIRYSNFPLREEESEVAAEGRAASSVSGGSSYPPSVSDAASSSAVAASSATTEPPPSRSVVEAAVERFRGYFSSK